MNKTLRNGLILGGIVVGVLVLAVAAQAAGLGRSNYGWFGSMMGRGVGNGYNMPYGSMMGGSGYNAQGGRGGYGYMMGGGQYGGMMGANGAGIDFNNMPHHNWNGTDSQNWQDCPYWNQQQDQQQ